MSPLLSLALLPAAVLLIYIYRKDTIEKEPAKLLVRLFLFGCLCAIPASILEGIGMTLISGIGGTFLQLFLQAFLVVAVAEEGCKFGFLCTAWKNPAFDYRFDAIVYAVFVSLGFAALENVLYVVQYGFGTALVRAVTSIPGHCFFGVFMGYWYGKAKYASRNGIPSTGRYLALSVLIPVLLHGFYDFCCFMSGTYSIFLLIFLAFLVPFFIFSIRLVNKASREDAPIDPNQTAGGDGFIPGQYYRSVDYTPGAGQPYYGLDSDQAFLDRPDARGNGANPANPWNSGNDPFSN